MKRCLKPKRPYDKLCCKSPFSLQHRFFYILTRRYSEFVDDWCIDLTVSGISGGGHWAIYLFIYLLYNRTHGKTKLKNSVQ